jgi:hypothetical protein
MIGDFNVSDTSAIWMWTSRQFYDSFKTFDPFIHHSVAVVRLTHGPNRKCNKTSVSFTPSWRNCKIYEIIYFRFFFFYIKISLVHTHTHTHSGNPHSLRAPNPSCPALQPTKDLLWPIWIYIRFTFCKNQFFSLLEYNSTTIIIKKNHQKVTKIV